MKVMQQNILEEKDKNMLKLDNKLFVSWADIEGLVEELWKKIVIGSMPINSVHGLKEEVIFLQ